MASKQPFLPRLSLLLLLGPAALLPAGCKAGPAEKLTDFFGEKGDMIEVKEVATFHTILIDPGPLDWDKYKKIHIAPVNVEYLKEMSWWEGLALDSPDKEGIGKLAEYTRDTFFKAHANNDHKNALFVADRPDGSETLVLEIALTEITPTKVWLNTVTTAFALPIDKGVVAFEARLRDGGSKRILAKFADREAGKQNIIFNIKDFTWYSHAKALIKEWADQSVEITNSEEDELVSDSWGFEFWFW